jgi:c-di-GMP-binding flagellar brake protein YcgR
MTEHGLIRPEVNTAADVTLVARGVTVATRIAAATTDTLVVVPAAKGDEGRAVVKTGTWDSVAAHTGDRVEVYWGDGPEVWQLNGVVVAVEDSSQPEWRISAHGSAERSQRRGAVRARVALPVYVPWLDGQIVGETVDVSEGGLRAMLAGWGLPPKPGTTLELSLTIDEESVTVRGEVIRGTDRGSGTWLLAVRFTAVPDAAADLLRRRVFRAMREERARQLD